MRFKFSINGSPSFHEEITADSLNLTQKLSVALGLYTDFLKKISLCESEITKILFGDDYVCFEHLNNSPTKILIEQQKEYLFELFPVNDGIILHDTIIYSYYLVDAFDEFLRQKNINEYKFFKDNIYLVTIKDSKYVLLVTER